jgi:hypothetical protein
MRLDTGRDSRLFTGSLQAVQRSKAFTGPGDEVIAEREEAAVREQRDEQRGEREATGEHRAPRDEPMP